MTEAVGLTSSDSPHPSTQLEESFSSAAAQGAKSLQESAFSDQSLVELLAAQVARTPNAVAVICGPHSLTYRELDARAAGLAARLIAEGWAPHTRIAVMLDRSLELVVALLAVLKAGSAYVPLDPNYPAARLRYVLDQVRPPVLIAKRRFLERIQSVRGPTLLLDEGHTEFKSQVGGLHAYALPEDVAYVIYTSGSTGMPKGVQIQHRAVVNFLQSMRKRPGMTHADTLLSVTTVGFDIFVLELFLPLTVGARVILAVEHEVVDGATLRDLLKLHSVTVLQATPATWQLLIDAGWRDGRLKMLCGGEALTRRLADDLLARGGELWNLYGPTETTVWSAALRVQAGDGPVLLGPPIDNTCFTVLDERLKPVEYGQPGELFIGGEGVALGYESRPELTLQKFIPNPIEDARYPRLYRTGDLVRQVCERGLECLEFLGRVDFQVKIRGHRIELGEIEATLLRHPAIAQAVAVAGQRESGPAELWVYIVLQSRAKELSKQLLSELRGNLSTFLPSYMHPSAITCLPKLPLMPNGKVDRKALPVPVKTAPATHVSRSSDVNQRLAHIWDQVLGIGSVDTQSNFFALGGNSAASARLLEKVETEFGVRLTLAALFGAPTFGQQVELLRRWNGRHYDFRAVVKLHGGGSRLPLFAIHNTGVYCYHLAQLLGPDQPVIALQVFDPAPRATLPTSIEEVAAEYVRLLRQCQPVGPYQLMGWCIGGVLAIEIARQLSASGAEVTFVGMIDAWAPGHLRRMSRVRAWLADRSYRLQLVLRDWRKVRTGQHGFMDFLRNRVLLRRLLRISGDPFSQPSERLFADRHQSGEHYDRWLNQYLDELADRYAPKTYIGHVLLLRSSHEPSGWFVDSTLGWDRFLPAGVDVGVLEGDHFTVFRGEGLRQLATQLSAAIAPRATGGSASAA